MKSATLPNPATRAEHYERRLREAKALQRWLRDDETRPMRDVGYTDAGGGEWELPHRPDLQSRSLDNVISTSGGYAVAETFSDKIDIQLKYFAAVRTFATVVTTPTGGDFRYPVVLDFDPGNEGVELPSNAQVSTLDVETFGSVQCNARKISSKMLQIPRELLTDCPLALEDVLARLLSERCGRGALRLYTNTLLPLAPVGVTTASATAIAGDELVSVYYGVDASYRDSDTAGWIMSSGMSKYIRELKDGTGRYLFRKSKKPGSRDTLLGKPILFNYVMSSTPTAGTVSALFGDLSKILVRDVGGVRIKKTDERFAENDQVGLAAYLRTSATLLDIGGQPIQALVQHS